MKLNIRSARFFCEHRAFYIGMLLLIILSSGIFIAFRTSSTSTWESVQNDRVECRMEDMHFSYSRDLGSEEIDSLEQAYDLTLQRSVSTDISVGETTIRVRPEYDKVNLYSAYEGRKLSGDKEILIDRFYCNAHDLSIGDTVILQDDEYTLVGILASPDYIRLLENVSDLTCNGNAFGLAVISNEDYEMFSDVPETVEYSVVFENIENETVFREKMAEEGVILSWMSVADNPRIAVFDGEIEAIVTMSSIAPIFLLLVSCMIMSVIMGRMLKKEYANIGTLSAMGYTRCELLQHYIVLPAAVSLIGSIIGLVLGVLGADPLLILSKLKYNVPRIDLNFTVLNILTAFFLPLFLMVAASLISILYALRLDTIILLKSNSGKQKRGLLTRIIPNKIGSFRFRFRGREMLSNLPRSALMVAGMCVSATFLFVGILFYSSIDVHMNKNYDRAYAYEYRYSFHDVHVEDPSEGEPFMVVSVDASIDSGNLGVTLVGIEDHSEYVILEDINGQEIPLEGTVFSRSTAERLGLETGDTLQIQTKSDEKEYLLTVDSIADIKIGDRIFMQRSLLIELFDLPENAYVGVFSSEKISFDDEELLSVQSKKDAKEGMQDSIGAMSNLLYVLGAVAAVIGVIVIYTVTLLLISENSKNISMLKVMGYHNKEISSLLTRSGVFLVLIGIAAAVPLSETIISIFYDALTANMFVTFVIHLRSVDILGASLFILIIYYIALIPARRKILSVNLAESLKGRE